MAWDLRDHTNWLKLLHRTARSLPSGQAQRLRTYDRYIYRFPTPQCRKSEVRAQVRLWHGDVAERMGTQSVSLCWKATCPIFVRRRRGMALRSSALLCSPLTPPSCLLQSRAKFVRMSSLVILRSFDSVVCLFLKYNEPLSSRCPILSPTPTKRHRPFHNECYGCSKSRIEQRADITTKHLELLRLLNRASRPSYNTQHATKEDPNTIDC